MATSRVLRFACIAAVALLISMLAYWAILWSGGPFWLEPSGGHDGAMCRVSVTSTLGGTGSFSAPCGVSMTVGFALGISGIAIAGIAGAIAVARASRAGFRVAMLGAAGALGVVGTEAWTSYEEGGAAGLGPVRGPIHVAIILFALASFSRAARSPPRNAEAAPMASAAPE